MTPIAHIRKNVLELSQVEMAEVAKTTQSTVSRWENGELVPDLNEMDRIRAYAMEAGKPWDDTLFFAVPQQDSPNAP